MSRIAQRHFDEPSKSDDPGRPARSPASGIRRQTSRGSNSVNRSLASGFVHFSPENREKSRSVVQTVAPCSSAIAASDGVHDKRTGGLAVVHKAAQDVPVPLARLENAGGRLGKPGGDRRLGLGCRKRTIEYPGIGRNPQKGPQREPREADKIRPRQHGFQPGSAFLVLFGSWMVGVEQQVRVDEDQW